MHSLSGVCSAATLVSRDTPAGDPVTRSSSVCDGLRVLSLSLRELEPLPRPRPARLLALDRTRIPRQQALFPQLLAVPLVGEAQRPRDRETQRARLTRLAPP